MFHSFCSRFSLGHDKKEQLTPFPQSNDEGARRPKPAILASLKWGGGGGGWSKCSINFVQDSAITSGMAAANIFFPTATFI